jgi:hypothetical protein
MYGTAVSAMATSGALIVGAGDVTSRSTASQSLHRKPDSQQSVERRKASPRWYQVREQYEKKKRDFIEVGRVVGHYLPEKTKGRG